MKVAPLVATTITTTIMAVPTIMPVTIIGIPSPPTTLMVTTAIMIMIAMNVFLDR